MRPAEKRDEWFNMLVLHQNRHASACSVYPRIASSRFLSLLLVSSRCLACPLLSDHWAFLRIAHTATSFIPETQLDAWLNLIIWGHEHECLITPQPSSVAEVRAYRKLSIWLCRSSSSLLAFCSVAARLHLLSSILANLDLQSQLL